MKKRILFVIYSIYGGGAERQMQYILRYIDREKFQPRLCVFHLTGHEEEVVPKDIPVHDLSTGLRPASFFLLFKLAGLILKIKPDRILSYMWGVNLIAIAAGIFTRTPVVASERTSVSFDIKSCSFSRLKERVVSFLYSKGAEKIIAVSWNVSFGLVESLSLKQERVAVIHSGIDLKEIRERINEYVPSCQNYVLACGCLEQHKNFGFLIESMTGMRDLNLVVLGKGSEKDLLEGKAKRLGVNLILPGYVNNPYPYFKKAKLFVLTSLYEGFPNVILEAMACGAPVVAVDCPGGIREIIQDGHSGLVVPQGDKEALSSAILKIAGNRSLTKELTTNAAKTVSEFDAEEMTRKYESFLD